MTNHRWLASASRSGVLTALAGAAVLISCRKPTEGVGNRPTDGPDSAANEARARAAPLVNGSSSVHASGDAGGFVVATRRACRVMALRGAATSVPRFDSRAYQPLARGDLLPEGGLVELGPDTELTVQATVSTREIAFIGPALAEACPGGEEAVRLSRGTVTGYPGAGVRPGADVWIATPLGVVRFSDAKIEIAVANPNAEGLKVTVVTGQATFVPAEGVLLAVSPPTRDGAPSSTIDDRSAGNADGADGAMALAPGATFEASRPQGALSRWVRDLVAACGRQARAARGAGRLVASPPDGGGVARSDLAFAHVRARRRARAACEAAWAGGALATGLLDAALRADLEGADATWRGAPIAPPHPFPSATSPRPRGAE